MQVHPKGLEGEPDGGGDERCHALGRVEMALRSVAVLNGSGVHLVQLSSLTSFPRPSWALASLSQGLEGANAAFALFHATLRCPRFIFPVV